MATLSQNITQAINDFEDIKDAIEDKGVTVESGTPTSEYADLIGDIPSGDDSTLVSVIENTAQALTIPDGTTKIGTYKFYEASSLTSVTLPDSLTTIAPYAFSNTGLTSIYFPNSITNISGYAFAGAALETIRLPEPPVGGQCMVEYWTFSNTPITSLTIPERVRIGDGSFGNCTRLIDVTINNPLLTIKQTAFYLCSNVETLTLPQGFNGNRPFLDFSTRFSAATIVSWLNALADRTGQSAYTLTIGSTNLAKLTAEQIAIATNKNWNLA